MFSQKKFQNTWNRWNGGTLTSKYNRRYCQYTPQMKRYDLIVREKLQYLAIFANSIPALRNHAKRINRMADKEVDGRVLVTYDTKSDPSGRCFANGGLQNIPRAYRNFLLPDEAVDIDIERCAPTILSQIAKKHGFNCRVLNETIADYAVRSKQVGGKLEVLKLLFGGGGPDLPDWALSLREEMKLLARYIQVHYADQWLIAQKKDSEEREAKEKNWKKEDRVHNPNIEGIFLSHLFQSKEAAYIADVDKQGRKWGMWGDCVTYMFDGLLITRRGISPIDLDLLSFHANATTGLQLKLVEKPITEIVDFDLTKPPTDQFVVRDHHEEAAKIVNFLMRGKAYESMDGRWVCNDGVWTESVGDCMNAIVNVAQKAKISLLTTDKKGDDHIQPFTCKYSQAEQTAKTALNNLEKHATFARDVVMRDYRRAHFTNGYWQFLEEIDPETGVYGRFVHGDFSCIGRIPYEFPFTNAQFGEMRKQLVGDAMDEDGDIEGVIKNAVDRINFVSEKILDPIFDNTEEGLGEQFMTGLARAIAGEIDKVLWILVGFRNCGKSMVFQLLYTALGKLYSKIDSAHFVPVKNQDPGRYSQFVLNIKSSRVCCISESEDGPTGALSGKKLKIFQSLKESATCRSLYVDKERPVYALCTPYMLVNDMPVFVPADAMREHARVITLPNKFVTKDKKEEFKNRMDKTIKIKNPKVEDWVQDRENGKAFLWILLAAYSPNEMEPLQSMTDVIEQATDEGGEDVVEKIVELTNNPDDMVANSEIDAELKRRKCGMRINLFTRTLQVMMDRLGEPKFDVKVKSRKLSTNGKSAVHGLRGIKWISQPSYDDSTFYAGGNRYV